MVFDLIKLEIVMTLLILTGVRMRRTGRITDAGRETLTNVVCDVILPCNIIMSFTGQNGLDALLGSLPIVGLSVLVMIVSVLLGKLAFRRFGPEVRVLALYGMINSNSMFIGLPVVESLFGGYGVMLQSLYMIFVRIIIWSYGMSLFTGGVNFRDTLLRTLTHPCVIAVGIGILIMVFDLQIPDILYQSMHYFHVCLMAMSMLLIGSVLSSIDLRRLFRPDVLWFSFIRLVAAPLLILLICLFLKTDYYLTGVTLILCAMPCASLTAVLAARYGADLQYGSLIVAVSTIIGTFTIPLWFLAVTRIFGM
jgi:predicted permease